MLRCKESKTDEEVLGFMEQLDLLSQSKDLGLYCPTERTLRTLLQEDIAIAFIHPSYYEGYNTENERSIIVFYTPWKSQDFE